MIPRLVVNIRILLLVALAGILQNADLLKRPGDMSKHKPSPAPVFRPSSTEIRRPLLGGWLWIFYPAIAGCKEVSLQLKIEGVVRYTWGLANVIKLQRFICCISE
jgi:hypothetical protein